ncbi:hypothetical protein F511_39792 [Dorcoceras hygrometricum]|uniref:Uncharacterized protein n=1 Tax=Dorcoceras hygrometricum TaxID=472368 RepID=A0A2Z7DAD7_9LAMI|nr:hypothetical protein F511_39792 [Dorcoceras hygrometricum]
MASSLISSSLHIDFDSVFGIDNAGLVQIFESFIATGLKDFLGCPTVFYEDALTEFFENGLFRDGMVVSTIGGTTVEISEEIFAAAFDCQQRISLFSGLSAADIRGFVSYIASERVLRNVQIAQDSAAVAPSVQLLDQCPFSSSCSDDSMHFDAHDTATTSFSLPATATPDVTEALAQLRASIEQIKGRDDVVEPVYSFASRQPTVFALRLSQFCTVFIQISLFSGLSAADIRGFVSYIASERVLRNVQIAQDSAAVAPSVQLLDQCPFSSSCSDDSIHFDAHDTATTSFSLPATATPDVTEALAKQLSAQAATAAIDVVDVRREVKELNAKVTYLDGQVAATRNDLLEFHAKAQESLNHITDQLNELVNYINRGDNDKKGEDSSSRGPQPPPDDQGRGSGNTGGDNVRTTDIVDRFSGSMSKEGLGRGTSGERRSSGNRSGHLKRRRYVNGGPFRRSFEDWLG